MAFPQSFFADLLCSADVSGHLGGMLFEQQQQKHPQEAGRAQGDQQLGEDGQAPVLGHVGQRVREHVHDLGHHALHVGLGLGRAALVGLWRTQVRLLQDRRAQDTIVLFFWSQRSDRLKSQNVLKVM